MAALPDPLGGITFPTLVDKIAGWLLNIGITISTIVVLWAAFLFMTSGGNQQKVTAAKQTLLYAIVGLTILLLAKGATSLISSDESGDVTVGDVNVTVPGGGDTGGVGPDDFVIGDEDINPVDLSVKEGENRDKLGQAGITVNKPAPTTELAEVIPSALDDVIRLKNACKCNIEITGGSESHGPCTGPYCHETGHALDLNQNNVLDIYLSDHLTYLRDIIIDGEKFPFYQGPNGTTYIREFHHWHVQYP